MLSGAQVGVRPPFLRALAFPLILFLLCAGFAWFLYHPTLGLPFFLDDLAAIPLLHPKGPLDVGRALHVIWPTDRTLAYHDHFRPVGWTSLVLDDALFGFRPEGFRAVAIVLHGLCGFLVSLVALRILPWKSWPASAGAGALFIAYPGSTEPVAWVAHRFTLLAAAWFLTALLAILRYAETGRCRPAVAVAALLALLSKDSMLAEIWALLPVALLAAPAGSRMSRTFIALALVGLPVGAVLGLRLLSLGALLPAFTEDGNVAETIDAASVLRALPATVLTFLAPVSGRRIGFLLPLLSLALALVAFGFRDPARPRSAIRLSATLLLGLGLSGFPTLVVDSNLDGSRRFYLPAAGFALLLVALARTWRLGVLVLLLAVSSLVLRGNQHAWHDAARILDKVKVHVEKADRGGDPILLSVTPDIPATWQGVPLFGPDGSHTPLYFRPPLRPEPLPVRVVRHSEVASEISRAGGPVAVVSFADRRIGRLTDDPSSVTGDLELDVSVHVPGPQDAAAEGLLKILRPEAGGPWPDPSPPDGRGTFIISLLPDEAGIFDRPFRLVVICAGVRGDFLFIPSRLRGLLCERNDGKVTISFPLQSLEKPLFPVPDAPRLAALAWSPPPGTPASMWLEELPPAGAKVVVRRSPRVSFILGGGGR